MGETKELAKKKKFKMPHTLVIIFIIILAAVLFTWIVPSGEYVQIEDPVTGRELIDPDSFHFVENTPVNPLRIMNYIIDGFMDAADLIFMLMFAGGAFHLITESGALQASIAKVARKFSNRFYIFIPMLTLIFTLIATNQGVNLFIPFVPITVMLSFALGLDSLVGVSIILLGGAVGFSTGTRWVLTPWSACPSSCWAERLASPPAPYRPAPPCWPRKSPVWSPSPASGTGPSAWWFSG